MDLKQKLMVLMKEYAEQEGTTMQFALRDVLTDLQHLCESHPEQFTLGFDMALAGANAAFEEETTDTD